MTQQIGQYRIISELGAGGMGVVYRALDVSLQREVAIKRLRSEFAANATVLERFRREAQMQAQLNHPNIAQLYTLVQDSESLCLVMEFVSGTVLTRFMPMTWETALPIILQVLEGLEYAHRRGILHRDIKPDNIIIDGQGTAKIMDFGIAHAIGSSRMTREKTIIGTLEYVSPERVLGQSMDARSDLYSTGVMLFEMIAGRLPFDFDGEYALMRCHVDEKPYSLVKFVPNAPASLDTVIQKALQKKPQDRYESCGAMALALREAAANKGVTLLSVAALLNKREPQPGPSTATSKEVVNWIARIRAVIDRNEFETAERMIDTALNDFPASMELAQMRTLLPRTQCSPRSSTPDLPVSRALVDETPESRRVREKLQLLLSLEKEEKIEEALTQAEAAASEFDSVALRVAACYFARIAHSRIKNA
jgi:serine/threonine protein kinase